jgi:hypothetical protein
MREPVPQTFVDFGGGDRLIYLTRGMTAAVSGQDHGFLSAMPWRAQVNSDGKVYAVRDWRYGGRYFKVYMHRCIAGEPEGMWVDHRNGTTLDNRRRNLRVASPSNNSANADFPIGASGFRGVTLEGLRWRARVVVAGVRVHLGMYDTALEAALAFDQAAYAAYGQFATLNFPVLDSDSVDSDAVDIPFWGGTW